jgi:predicted esterase
MAVMEHSLRVQRTARYYTLGGGARVHDVWIVCHGYGQLARDFIGPFAAIESPERIIVAPEALNRYYLDTRPLPHGPDSSVRATWMTREDREHEIADYIAYLDGVYDALKSGVTAGASFTALGFSQGAATVSRWAAATRARIDRVVLWAGMLPPDLEPKPGLFSGASLTFVVGESDASISLRRLDSELALLANAGVDCRVIRFPGGHHLSTAVLKELAAERGSGIS